MKQSVLVTLIKEVLQELNETSVTGTGAHFTPGTGAQYATPFAFSKNSRKNKATKYIEKLGYKQANKKKRPYHTKGFDYLEETK